MELSFSKDPGCQVSTSSGRLLVLKAREFPRWQVTGESQMKRAHVGRRVKKEALVKIVIDEHHYHPQRAQTDLPSDDGGSFFMHRPSTVQPLGHSTPRWDADGQGQRCPEAGYCGQGPARVWVGILWSVPKCQTDS